MSDATQHLGGLDILVNNAGIGARGTVEDNTDEEWRFVLDVNVVGLVRVDSSSFACIADIKVRSNREHMLDCRIGRPA